MPAKATKKEAAPKLQKPDGIERREVTMTNVMAVSGGIETHRVKDYVPLNDLEAYVADAKTRWQLVEVGSEPNNGPGFYKE